MDRKWIWFCIGVLLWAVILAPGAGADDTARLSRAEVGMQESGGSLDVLDRQVQAIEEVKGSLTEPQEKLTSDLLQLTESVVPSRGDRLLDLETEMRASGQFVSAGDPLPFNSRQTSDSDLVYVYIYLDEGTETRVVDPYCREVTDRDETFPVAVAWVEVQRLEELASLDAVKFIQTVVPPINYSGSKTTEGDAILRTELVRTLFGYRGSGMKVGIISNGVRHRADSVARGDLPSSLQVLSDEIGGDEGTAMLEIVHDIVPDAQLYFHDQGTNEVAMKTAIDRLSAAGCRIICDDVGIVTEPSFEDGIVASHVKNLISSGNVIYVSSAGNLAERHYQGTYYSFGGWHDFSRGSSTFRDLYVDIPPGGSVDIVLQWNDRSGYSQNDYDLYLFDYRTGQELDKSITRQSGTQNPIEVISGSNIGTAILETKIRVKRYSGSSRTLEVFIFTHDSTVYLDNLVPSDSIFGHAAVPGVVTVGAISAADPGHDDIRFFSSRGPVTISYPVAEVRQKPDITGIDDVSITGVGGFGSPFGGTSASAPHIAGMIAQVWAAAPTMTPNDVKALLTGRAVDLGPSGFDTTFGYGRADAMNMMNPVPTLTSISPVSITGGGPEFTLTVTGSNFLPTSKVRWNGGDRATAYDSPTQLKATIKVTDVAAKGTSSVTVFNPAPGGGLSNALTFSVTDPPPSILSFLPASADAGGQAFTLKLTGNGYVNGAKLRWNGGDRSTIVNSATQLTVSIPATDIAGQGTATLTVVNPDGAVSDAITFTTNTPLPYITTFSPASAKAKGSQFTLKVTGTGFTSASKVRWKGTDRTTVVISGTELTATIPATDIASAGTAAVTVYNPSPAATSNTVTFTVNSASGTPPPPGPGPGSGEVITTETATSSTYLGYSGTYFQQAQSVKAVNAKISEVQVALARKGSPAQAINFHIRATLKGPDLGWATISPDMITSTDYKNPSWVRLVASDPIPVTSGMTYYMVLDTDVGNLQNYYVIPINGNNPYKDGYHYKNTVGSVNSMYDMLMKVYFTAGTSGIVGSDGGNTIPIHVTIE